MQDMSRLGRDLSRCVLVDDTPLAFYFQPDHGVPVLQVGRPSFSLASLGSRSVGQAGLFCGKWRTACCLRSRQQLCSC